MRRVKRSTSINSYLVQRQTEWNWSLSSRVEHERKERERIRAICVFLSVYPATTFNDLPSKTIYLHRAISVGYQTKDQTSSSKDSRTSLPFVRSNFSLKNGGEDVYPVKYRKIYSKGCRLGDGRSERRPFDVSRNGNHVFLPNIGFPNSFSILIIYIYVKSENLRASLLIGYHRITKVSMPLRGERGRREFEFRSNFHPVRIVPKNWYLW